MTTAVERPGAKYFKGRIHQDGRMFPFVVWDGVRDYKNIPPPNLLVTENLTGRSVIAQIQNRKAGTEAIAALLEECDSAIIWARNHATYRSIVANIKRQSHGWLT
jgi:hypothetical protein